MQQVEIRVKGHLDQSWSEWLDCLAILYPSRNETVLTGLVTDQAALYGLMAKLRDLGVKLISVNSREIKQNEDSDTGE